MVNATGGLLALGTQEGQVALAYRLVRFLRFFRASQLPARIHNSIVLAMAWNICLIVLAVVDIHWN